MEINPFPRHKIFGGVQALAGPQTERYFSQGDNKGQNIWTRMV